VTFVCESDLNELKLVYNAVVITHKLISILQLKFLWTIFIYLWLEIGTLFFNAYSYDACGILRGTQTVRYCSLEL
jgi:hypothetical protein